MAVFAFQAYVKQMGNVTYHTLCYIMAMSYQSSCSDGSGVVAVKLHSNVKPTGYGKMQTCEQSYREAALDSKPSRLLFQVLVHLLADNCC